MPLPDQGEGAGGDQAERLHPAAMHAIFALSQRHFAQSRNCGRPSISAGGRPWQGATKRLLRQEWWPDGSTTLHKDGFLNLLPLTGSLTGGDKREEEAAETFSAAR